ncbi:unnamed protein product [Lymnaea stagnalis]|uniref:Glutathione peroxidase n=1 Tax=Lymnaea stagnalis TaxID=6523 RepID=A0AAV2HP43_LYMST
MLLLILVAVLLIQCDAGLYFSKCLAPPGTSAHDFLSRDLGDSYDVSIARLTKGKLTMVVNVATFCTFTKQYIQMNQLLASLPPYEFTILGFPSNQFGHQEPGANRTEILNGLYYVRPGRGYTPHPNMHLMLKGDVNGDKESELYAYLKVACPNPTTAAFNTRESFWEPIKINDIAWNFEKFLVSPSGVPLYRFRSMVEPRDLVGILEALLAPAVNVHTQARELEGLLADLDATVDAWEKAVTL